MKWLYSFIAIAITILYAATAHGQIKGRVTDYAKSPLLFCPVIVERVSDSVKVASATTDTTGHFVINEHLTGTFRLHVSYIGYIDYTSSPFSITDNQVRTLPDVELRPANINLRDVHVISDKPFIENKLDRTVYNVGSNDLLTGKNGMEILQTLPGVMAPDDGSISVAGRNNTMIMIDGRPIYLSGQDADDYLKSIDASQIERVEIVTNPSAKYDAAGGAIINIVLKKNSRIGLNGNVSLTDRQAYYNSQNGSLNASYRTKKWNIFGNGGINSFHNYYTTDITRDFLVNTPQQTFLESTMNTSYGYNTSGRIGTDYMPDENQTFEVLASGLYSPSWNNNNHSTAMYSINPVPDSSNNALGSGANVNTNFTGNASYTYKVDSTGKEFSVEASYINYRNSSSSQKTIYYYNTYDSFLRSPDGFDLDIPHNTSTLTAQADYTLPITKNSKLEAGIKAVSETTDDNDQYWNLIQGVEIPDTIRSNHFNLTEDIYSAYSRYTGKLGRKISYSAGLRFENTQDKGIQYVHDTSFTRNYSNLFPSGSISWQVDTNNTLSAYYSENINRPGYSDLNPFLQYNSPYSYSTGNINIQPQFSYNYDLTYSFKSLISASLEYRHSSNIIEWLWEPNNTTHISYDVPVNLSSSDGYEMFLRFYKTVSKHWTAMSFISLQQTYYNGLVEGSTFGNSGLSFYSYLYSGFTFNHGWKSDISFNYHSASVYGFTTSQPSYNLNVSISKKFFKERGTIRAACSNLITPDSYVWTQSVLNTNVHTVSYSYPRVFTLGLTWKLGKTATK